LTKALPKPANPPKKPEKKPEKNRDMLTAEYLRRQADACLRIARACFDLTSAERLRLMAGELKTKAAEIENNEKTPKNNAFASPMTAPNASSSGKINRK
jgi:hypothetical protein